MKNTMLGCLVNAVPEQSKDMPSSHPICIFKPKVGRVYGSSSAHPGSLPASVHIQDRFPPGLPHPHFGNPHRERPRPSGVQDGHKTPEPTTSNYAGVVSRESVRIAFTYASMMGLSVCAADIKNAYLQAPSSEKHFRSKRNCDYGFIVFPARSIRINPDIGDA